ncbi:hypothetical protein [Nocardioides limicola]|uniref:hypothetical protein n=1 Tax=Nocardioides limicola TaxID=2803368 RepID=UPI00193B7A8F|nr:hypothetical protein [Nocardioides sp. DJM-14]
MTNDVTVIVEPDPGGHRFQAVANVARVAARTDDVLLLTSQVGRSDNAYQVLLEGAGLELDVEVPFAEIYPPTAQIAAAIAEVCRRRPVARVVVMDADQSLKRWWWVARRELRRLPRRPKVIFMLTRYPARLQPWDTFGWKLRVAKASLALLAMITGTLHRVAGFAGREDMAAGWLVKRVRDPAVCEAHSRDRARLRAEHGLPPDRRLAGIFGAVTERKNAPLVLAALDAAGGEIDLLLAGGLSDEVAAWLDGLPAERRDRVLTRDGFLPDKVLDELVACVDVVPIALTNNGPSGIMGKALAAGVPVVTAGSQVRAREVRATGGGVAAEVDADSMGAAVLRVLDPAWSPQGRVSLPTADEFAEVLLGVR